MKRKGNFGRGNVGTHTRALAGLAKRGKELAGRLAERAARRGRSLFDGMRRGGGRGRSGPPGGGAGGAPHQRPSDLIHFTTKEAAESIRQSQRLGKTTQQPIYALEGASVPPKWWQRAAAMIGRKKTEAAVPIPASAAGAFRKPIPVGPVQLFRRLGGVRFTAPGRINLATGAFESGKAGINYGEAGFIIVDGVIMAATAKGVAEALED